jgi:geranylgeranyl diphosphate synthase type I
MDPFTRYLPALEKEMRQATAPRPDSPELLYGMLHYHLGWVDADFKPEQQDAGKRLRPIYLFLCCEAQDGDWEQALPVAAAVELLHNFSLIHDDIEDQDVRRRGRATVWTLWGEAQGINAGDTLFSLAHRVLLRLRERDLSLERTHRIHRRFISTTIALTEGQCMDIAFETMPEVNEATYLQMVSGKTAALIAFTCEAGGIVAGASEERTSALHDFGYNLGMCFQMQDDLLGLWGDPKRTGKPVGADLRQHKKTLPILHGLAHNAELRALLQKTALSEGDIRHAQTLLEETGSRAYTHERAESYHQKAMDALTRSGGGGAPQATLKSLTEKLLNRDK